MKSLHVYGGATAEWVLRSLLTRTTNTGLIDTVWVRQRCCTDKIEGQKTLQLEDKMFSIRLESSHSWQFVFIVSIVQTSPVSSSSPCGLNIPRMKAPDSLLHYIELCTHQYYHFFLIQEHLGCFLALWVLLFCAYSVYLALRKISEIKKLSGCLVKVRSPKQRGDSEWFRGPRARRESWNMPGIVDIYCFRAPSELLARGGSGFPSVPLKVSFTWTTVTPQVWHR